MRYDRYESKVSKLLSFFKLMFKHRVKIIISAAVAIVTTVALMATKGIMVGAEPCPEVVMYGDKIEYSVDAFMSDVSYEYCTAGEENWSSEAPVYPGDYMVRAITKSGFGKRRGKAQSFSIVPRPVNVSVAQSTLEYGSEPTAAATLAYSDVMECDGFDYSEYEGSGASITPRLEAISIYNESGDRVNHCYTLTPVARDVVFGLRHVTLTVKDAVKTYDGEALVATEYELDKQLAAGDSFGTLIFTGSRTDAGIYEGAEGAGASFVVINEKGADVTALYSITVVPGKLTVNPRDITLTTHSDSKTYDGTALSLESYAPLPEGALVDGHSISLSGWASIINSGSIQNSAVCTVLDADGNDISGNYNVIPDFGTLSVTKREVSVTTGSIADYTYNGLPQGYEIYDITSGSLAEGDAITVSDWAAPINAGTHTNTATIAVLCKTPNEDGSNPDNYVITPVYGSIEIARKAITVKTPTSSHVYDGTAISNNDITHDPLAADDFIDSIVGVGAINVGEYENIVTVTISSPTRGDVTLNYDIIPDNGTLTVTKRPVLIYTGSDSKEYDGTALVFADWVDQVDGEHLGLVSGHSIHAPGAFNSLIRAGSITNEYVGEVFIYVGESYSAENDVTHNYELSWENEGTLTVTKRAVAIVTEDYTGYYDGGEHTYVAMLAPGHSLALTDTLESGTRTYADATLSAVINEVGYTIIHRELGDVTDCYERDERWGSVNIEPRPIYVYTDTASKEYDGSALECKEWLERIDTSYLGLLPGHKIYAPGSYAYIVNVGSVTNVYDGEVYVYVGDSYTAEGDITHNYAVTWVSEGTLTVTPRSITVLTGTTPTPTPFTYNGYGHTYEHYSIISGALAAGDELVLYDWASPINAGTHTNTASARVACAALNPDGTHPDGNYIITVNYGTIEIARKTITVETPSSSHVYNGAPISDNAITYDPLAADDYISSIVGVGAVNVGSYLNEVTLTIWNPTRGNVTSNYNIVPVSGTLTVTERPILIYTGSDSKEYDGTPLECKAWVDHRGNDYLGLVAGHTVDARGTYSSLTRVGIIPNEYDGEIYIIDAAGNDVSSNYALTALTHEDDRVAGLDLRVGTLKVTPTDIVVTSESYRDYYDGISHVFREVCIHEDSLGTLRGDDYFYVEVPNTYLNVTGGAVVNEIEFIIKNSAGDDVTDNYVIAYRWGTVEIMKRPVYIYTGSATKEYDGTALDCRVLEDYIGEGYLGIVAGQSIHAPGSYSSLIKAGSVTNYYYGDIFIHTGESYSAETDVTFNYDITFRNDGELTVTKRALAIYTDTDEFFYDGIERTYTVKLVDGYSLASTDTFNPETRTYLDATHYPTLNVIGYTISHSDPEVGDVTGCYEIDERWGTVHVKPRPIYIYTGSATKEYDGTELVCREWVHQVDDTYLGLLVGHTLYTPGSFSAPIKAGIHTNRYDGEVYIHTGEVLSTETDVSHNYSIRCENLGTLTITKKALAIYTDSPEPFYYDGKEHSFTVKLADGYSLAPTDTLNSSTRVYINATVSPITNEIEYEIIHRDIGDVKDSYEIDERWGSVHIKHRPITIVSQSYSGTYDGIEKNLNRVTVSDTLDMGLCEGHSLKCGDSLFKYATGGEVENVVPVTILDEDDHDVWDNYTVNYVKGKVKIDPKPIIIRTATDGWEYDGTWHVFDIITVDDDGICTCDKLVVKRASTYRNATISGGEWGAIENVIEYDIVDRDNPSLSVKSSYDVDERWGEINITRRAIKLTTESPEPFYYDGKWHHYYDITISHGSIAAPDTFEEDGKASFKEVVTEGYIAIPYKLLGSDGLDTSYNYIITEDWGRITIKPRPITLESDGYTGTYDNEEHVLDLRITGGMGLCAGHTLDYTKAIFRDVVDVLNDIPFTIRDEDGIPVNDANYDITYNRGRVTITPKEIRVSTGTKSWEYDGAEHKHPEFTFDYGYALFEGHRATVVDSTGITDVGSKNNVLTFMVTDEALANISRNYRFVQAYGTLTVTGATPPIEPPAPDEPSTVMFELIADVSGRVYLKQQSYGAYTGTDDWGIAPEYSELIHEFASAYYLPTMSASGGAVPPASIIIDSKYNIYVLPYFSDTRGADIQRSDTVMIGDASDPYTVYYYPSLDGAELPEALREYEARYAEFVRESYSAESIDAVTLEFLRRIIDEKGFDASDPDIIEKVADYIKGAATYNLDYNPGLDASTNMVVDFLSRYGEGVCRHYAASATLLYRALGIPARYTVGFVGNVEAGEKTVVTAAQAHAWVEVYIDGLGWINVEVTGSGEGSPTDPPVDPPTDPDEPPVDPPAPPEGGEITIRPLTQSKIYDSYPLYARNEIDDSDPVLRQLLSDGYTYSVRVTGSQTAVGVGESHITEFLLFHPDGTEVSSAFDIIYEPGRLYVTAGVIKIHIPEKDVVYDGTAHGYSASDYTVVEMPDGVSLSISSIGITLTKPGYINSAAVNANIGEYLDYLVYSGGEDVTEGYLVQVVSESGGDYDILTVRRRAITVDSDSHESVYDGHEYTVGGLDVIEGALADGHGITFTANVYKNAVDTDNVISYTIVDADANDVTDCYLVTEKWGKVVIYKRAITITTPDYSGTYDGEWHEFDEITIISGTLADGETLEALRPSRYKHAVTDGNNEILYDITDKHGVSTWSNYAVKTEWGRINIERIDITISTESYDGIYDGIEHSFSSVTLAGGTLISGDVLGATGSSSFRFAVSGADNAIPYSIIDDESEDVTDCYNITELWGEVNILPITVYITTGSDVWDYDGNMHSCDEYTVTNPDALIPGDIVVLIDIVEQKHIGVWENVLTFKITDASGEDVSGGYELSMTYGTLVINGSAIEIRPTLQHKEYDGTPLYAKNEIDETDSTLRTLLADRYTYTVTVSGSRTAVGVGKSIIEEFHLYDPYGNEVTDLFDIQYKEGELRVSHGGTIEIYIYEKSFVYSANAFTYDSDEYYVISIPDGIALIIDSIDITRTDVGAVSSSAVNGCVSDYITYRVIATETGEEVTDAYLLKVVSFPDREDYDILTVTEREITVKTADASKEYDGEPLTNPSFYISIGALGEGHVLDLEVTGSQTSVGTSANLCNKESVRITDATGYDVTGNYKVKIELGVLEVEA